jgi:hypothetical protein
MKGTHRSLLARLRHDWRNYRFAAASRYWLTTPGRTTAPRILIAWWFCQWMWQELRWAVGAGVRSR